MSNYSLLLIVFFIGFICSLLLLFIGCRGYFGGSAKTLISQVMGLKSTESDRSAQEELLLIKLVSSLPLPIALFYPGGKVIAFNQTLTNLLGYTKEDIPHVDDHWVHFYPSPEYRKTVKKEWQARIDKSVATGFPIEPMEVKTTSKSGRDFELEVHTVPIGNILVSIRIDLTKQKQAQSDTQKLFDNIPGMFWRVENAPDYPVEFFSYGAKEISGFSAEDFMSKKLQWVDIIYPEDLDQVIEAVALTTEKKEMHDITYRIIKANGDIRWVRSIGIFFDSDISGKQFLDGYVFDIQRQKELEATQTQLIEEAKKANKAKSEFLANMSHEVRTPMNAIIGMSYLALQAQLAPKQRNYIEKVHNSAENLLGIINDILDFSKIEAGKLDIDKSDFRLEQVFDNTANLIGINAEEKGLELLFSINIDIPTALIGDRLRLNQILLNLGNNAVKFTERGEVLVGVEELSRNEGGIELHFWVKDSGMGMNDETQSKLFESFSQADTSTTRKYGGTGLGLAISKQLIEMMEGKIWVESDVGKGSTFHFTAHFGLQKEELPKRAFYYDELKGLRALVVDDNRCANNVLVEMLESFGLSVESAFDGVQAIDTVLKAEKQCRPFDLVMMDWKMPKMNGIEVVEQLQQRYCSQTPTIIMVTAYSRDEVLKGVELLEVSLQSILMKPVSPSTLLEAMGDALGKYVDVSTSSLKRNTSSLERMKKLKGAKILLVEDNDINQELAIELLQQCDIEVILAENGQQALDILGLDPDFDGVLMDCQMPVMDGYEASRKIREIECFECLPILAMTANAMVGDREKVITAGMNDHISKPLNVELMYETMARWISPQCRGLASTGIEKLMLSAHDNCASKKAVASEAEILELSKLQVLLEGNDTGAEEQFELVKRLPSLSKYSKELQRLEDMLDEYRFDDALNAVKLLILLLES
ncbi:response regulator [Shewanella eurypsychrophilus]|uniref:histidine kinase n=1 Tax=Shewanella eurypsychrophilus TaxID=2593656 RepID=A0ABX6VCY3_9GAMM|nr:MULTISPECIES: response regulator [Shewanella]QFU23055.1 response regulator [Shewanella sp. YLB-09]QPG58338.1 response regulator [Shewanella eurypsychrophilus]